MDTYRTSSDTTPQASLGDLPALSHTIVDEARDNLLRSIYYLPVAERSVVMQACVFGDKAHIKDVRKSGEPYITHPIAVADILAGFRLDKDTLVAAILHDTVEDTDTTLEQVSDLFGETVARLVDGVTKLKSSKTNKQAGKAATFTKIINATLSDPRVLIIKLSDRLHNMSTMDAVREEKQKSTAKETLDFYIPLARLFGLNDIADYIELLCYRNLNPQMYTKMSDKLLQHGLGRQLQKGEIQSYLQSTLSKLNLSGLVQVMDNRPAIYRQFFKNRGDANRLARQYEFEITLDDIESCDKLAYHLIQTHNIANDCIADHIRKPLPGGNQSLTLIYHANYDQIKVTLLTQRMKKSARLGVIGQDSDISHSVIQASLRNMKDLMGDNDDVDATAIIDEMMSYLNERKIVCYSPQGRAYELPRGSTALDFAYAVGPSIGNIATGANINHQHGKLGQMLAAGDMVEIETDPNAVVQSNWLGFVATNKARKEILKALKNLPEATKIEHGKNALDRALKTYGKTIDEISGQDWQDILQWRGLDNQNDLFMQLIDGTLLPQLVISRLFSDIVDSSDKSAITQSKHLLSGIKGVEVEFSKCCNPIYGDPIVGHISKHGLMIHRHKCFSVVNIRKEHPYQIITMNWKETLDDNHNDESLRFSAFLRISTQLNQEQISQVIYEMKALNIGIEATNIKHDSKEGRAAGTTTLQIVVRSRNHLAEGIDKLRHILNYPNIIRLYHG